MDYQTKKLIERAGVALFGRRNGMQFATSSEARVGRTELPKPGESVAVAPRVPKTASLSFDRVWSPPTRAYRPPADMRVYGATEIEIVEQLYGAAYQFSPEKINVLHEIFADLHDQRGWLDDWTGDAHDHLARLIADSLRARHDIPAVPVFTSAAQRDRQYSEGKDDVVASILANLNVVDEKQISWEQVVEFRRDQEARKHYRRLTHWLDAEMLNKTQNFIAEEIEGRLDKYEWALRKHGISTVVGVIESTLDIRFVGAVSAAAATAGIAGGPVAAGIVAGGFVVGKVSVGLVRALLDLGDVKRTSESQVAFVHEARNALRSPGWAG